MSSKLTSTLSGEAVNPRKPAFDAIRAIARPGPAAE
jgi:hypothetical protein